MHFACAIVIICIDVSMTLQRVNCQEENGTLFTFYIIIRLITTFKFKT